MKKILITTTILFLFVIANAQIKRTNVQNANDRFANQEVSYSLADTTWHISRFQHKKINNGNVKVHSVPGKYTLYATYKNRKLTDYYAIDAKGNKIQATYSAKNDTSLKCNICITQGDQKVCYMIDCSKMPPPKGANAATRTTN